MNPLVVLLLVIIGFPLLELYVLIEVGSDIGALPTVLLTVFTAILGVWLVRIQGLSTALRARESMARGEMPAIEMLETALLSVAGLLLILPGFISDVLGFLLLVPPVRRWVVLRWVRRMAVDMSVTVRDEQRSERRVIEGEYRRED